MKKRKQTSTTWEDLRECHGHRTDWGERLHRWIRQQKGQATYAHPHVSFRCSCCRENCSSSSSSSRSSSAPSTNTTTTTTAAAAAAAATTNNNNSATATTIAAPSTQRERVTAPRASLSTPSTVRHLRGAYATEAIEKGALLFRLTRTIVLDTCDESTWKRTRMAAVFDGSPRRKRKRPIEPFLRAAIGLLREIGLGDRSVVYEYVRCLPSSSDVETIEDWSKDERRVLRGTSLEEKGAVAADVLWDRLIGPIILAHPAIWPNATREKFRFACNVLRTRAYYVGGPKARRDGPYLLPGVDMLNHAVVSDEIAATLRFEEKEEEEEDEDEGKAGDDLRPIDDLLSCRRQRRLVFYMHAERDIPKGAEIRQSYDDTMDAAQTLKRYGFVPDCSRYAHKSKTKKRAHISRMSTGRLRLRDLLDAFAEEGGGRRDMGKKKEDMGTSTRPRRADPNLWSERVRLVRRLLELSDGMIGVTRTSPIPDELFTSVAYLAMPAEDLLRLTAESRCPRERPRFIDDEEMICDEPVFAARIFRIIAKVADIAMRRFDPRVKRRRERETKHALATTKRKDQRVQMGLAIARGEFDAVRATRDAAERRAIAACAATRASLGSYTGPHETSP